MPDIFQLIASWKKQIFITVLLSLIVATAIVFILPPKYLSSTTAVPANPVTADRSIVFNDNIRDLYNSLGSSSDLDMIIGTGQLDTIYIAVAKKFDLVPFYSIRDSSTTGILKAARSLKKDSKVMKTEFGELQVRVWCTDKLLGPKLANALMDELASIHQDLLNANNKAIYKVLNEKMESLDNDIDNYQNDALSGLAETTQKLTESARKQQALYEQVKNEFRLMTTRKTPALHIIEKARLSDKPDSPNKILILVATAIVSFLFALWLALLLDKRQKAGK